MKRRRAMLFLADHINKKTSAAKTTMANQAVHNVKTIAAALHDE